MKQVRHAVRNRSSSILVALCTLAIVANTSAQSQSQSGSTGSPVAPVSSGTPGAPKVGIGALMDRFTTLEDRDISVLVTSGNETTLSSQMAGKIKKVNYGLGDSISANAVILEFDCEEQNAQIQSAEAEYRGARETHLTKLRLQALGAAGELEVTVAASVADKAKSQITLRESQLAYCKVVAPFSGRLVKLKVKLAESVSLGQPLLEMVNPGTLKAQLYVPAAWLGWVKTGTRFSVKTTQDGRAYSARVTKLNARVEGVSQTLELEARFDGSTQGLLPGMVGTAIFPDRPKP